MKRWFRKMRNLRRWAQIWLVIISLIASHGIRASAALLFTQPSRGTGHFLRFRFPTSPAANEWCLTNWAGGGNNNRPCNVAPAAQLLVMCQLQKKEEVSEHLHTYTHTQLAYFIHETLSAPASCCLFMASTWVRHPQASAEPHAEREVIMCRAHGGGRSHSRVFDCRLAVGRSQQKQPRMADWSYLSGHKRAKFKERAR